MCMTSFSRVRERTVTCETSASSGCLVEIITGSSVAPAAVSDERLRGEDASWGVRDLEAVCEMAAEFGFRLQERIPMPANNQTLVFRGGTDEPAYAGNV